MITMTVIPVTYFCKYVKHIHIFHLNRFPFPGPCLTNFQSVGDGMLFSVCQSTGYMSASGPDPCKQFACMHDSDAFAMIVDPSGINAQTCQQFKCNPGDVAGRADCSHPNYLVTCWGAYIKSEFWQG